MKDLAQVEDARNGREPYGIFKNISNIYIAPLLWNVPAAIRKD